jgi:hypothetical protein
VEPPEAFFVRPDDPMPGRLASLGAAVDRADASDLLTMLITLETFRKRTGKGLTKLAREALWWMWEQPRLPPPLIRGKYPMVYPWSPSARALLERTRAEARPDGALRGVIIEHRIPARLFISTALDESSHLDVTGMQRLLAAHGAAAIVTIEDDKQMSASGVAFRMPDGWDGDVWARPRFAGLDPQGFAPVGGTSAAT